MWWTWCCAIGRQHALLHRATDGVVSDSRWCCRLWSSELWTKSLIVTIGGSQSCQWRTAMLQNPNVATAMNASPNGSEAATTSSPAVVVVHGGATSTGMPWETCFRRKRGGDSGRAATSEKLRRPSSRSWPWLRLWFKEEPRLCSMLICM